MSFIQFLKMKKTDVLMPVLWLFIGNIIASIINGHFYFLFLLGLIIGYEAILILAIFVVFKIKKMKGAL